MSRVADPDVSACVPAYVPPPLLRNGHAQTVWAGLFRRVAGVAYRRERIETPDGDFLDLDWCRGGAPRLAVLSHGLEGDTGRPYVRGMARALSRFGWDVLAWNYRGCSGEPNRRVFFYHSGATADLDVVVRHALATGRYAAAALVGFSLGGNLTLKYVGERGGGLDPRLRAAVALSVPCDLAAGADHLARPANAVYMRRFLRALAAKVRAKAERFPGEVDVAGLAGLRTFHDFDGCYTAPLHGFRDAHDYWRRCSSKAFLGGIRIPTLLVNASDDPFLPPACYPVDEARGHPYLRLEVPAHGGHLGFVAFGGDGLYWSERRAAAFLEEATGS